MGQSQRRKLISILNMDILYNLVEKLKKNSIIILLWYLWGKPIPPPHIYKQKIVRLYGKKFRINILVESGTFKGDMVYGVRNGFKKIITIELSDYFFKKATVRLKNFKNIRIIKGDSGRKIKQILKFVKGPAVFWLDGHYSGGITSRGKLNTPIVQELQAIFSHKIKSHVILIDDARCFNGKNDYPKINQLKKLIPARSPTYSLEIKEDIIRITPE